MGLLILIVIGAVLGWLATIILQIENGRQILGHMMAGIIGSLIGGLFGGHGAIIGSVSALSLAWATAGTLVALAAFILLRRYALRS